MSIHPDLTKKFELFKPAMAFLLFLGLSVAGSLWEKRTVEREAQEQVQRIAERLAGDVEERLQNIISGLNGAKGAFAITALTRSQFRTYVASRDMAREFSGVHGFSFNQRVLRTDLDQFTRAVQADGVQDFSLRQLEHTHHDDLYIVKYIEPMASNAAALGLDYGSEPVRRNAVLQAMDSGLPTMSAITTLAQSSPAEPAVLLMVPVYNAGEAPANVSERRNKLHGVLVAPVVVSELLHGVQKSYANLVDLQIYDTTDGNNHLAYNSDHDEADEASFEPGAESHFYMAQSQVKLMGRQWSLHVRSEVGFQDTVKYTVAWLILIGGTSLGLLLALNLRAQGRLYTATTAQVDERTRELKLERRRLETIFETVTDGIFIVDETGLLLEANGAFLNLLGLDGCAFGRFRIQDCDVKYESTVIQKNLETLTTEQSSMHNRSQFKTTQGQIIDVEISAKGSSKEGRKRVYCTVRDITERLRRDKGTQRAESLLHTALDVIDEAFVIYDQQDCLVYCNDKYRQIYAPVSDLMVPGTTFETIIRAGAMRGDYLDAVGRVDEWVAERLAVHRQSNSRLIQRLDTGRVLRIVERRTDEGLIVGFRVDITELENARLAAEAATVAKSQFLAAMSHEIRTPMNAVLGMLSLLKGTPLNRQQIDYAEKSETAAKSLLELLNEILDFSKVESGMLMLDIRPMRLDQLMRDLSVILSANLGRKPVELLFEMDPQLPEVVSSDLLRLKQVLINLCSNALKFTSEGEVRVSLKLERREGDVAWIEFGVNDTGIGIAHDKQATIFEAFTQAEASITRRFGGTGLGLAISKKLVHLMAGDLQVNSTPGQGSRFYFCLPMQVVTQAQPEVIAVDDTPALPHEVEVLVVDDNRASLDLMVGMLNTRGQQATGVLSGAQALQLLHERCAAGRKPFDVVLLDWQMPDMDGWDTARRIKAIDFGQQPQPRLIMVSAQGTALLADRTAEDQALLSGFLTKPVSPGMLLEALAHTSEGHHYVSKVACGQHGLERMRILVVEDNLLNQQVAEELLTREGALVSLAANGRLGVEAVATAEIPFDVVLMDLQMPVLDGWAATREIRQTLGLKSLPIVAMSANAMPEDRAESMSAGMNEHVSKPFDIEQLVMLLRRLLGWSELPATDKPARLNHTMQAQAPFEPENPMGVIDFQQALKWTGGDTTLYLHFARTYMQDVANYPELLAQHLARGEQQDAMRIMHTLKGLSATVGARNLADFADKHEHALKAQMPEPQDINTLVEQVRGGIEAARAEIGRITEKIDAQLI